jgi:hypothetical protein
LWAGAHGRAAPGVPLLATAAVSIGIGFAASAMYASAELHHPLVAPGTAYYALTASGIVAALAILVGTFPLLARITGPEVARNEYRSAWRPPFSAPHMNGLIWHDSRVGGQ